MRTRAGVSDPRRPMLGCWESHRQIIKVLNAPRWALIPEQAAQHSGMMLPPPSEIIAPTIRNDVAHHSGMILPGSLCWPTQVPAPCNYVIRSNPASDVIRSNPASDSDAIRPPIPTEVGHPFRSKLATP